MNRLVLCLVAALMASPAAVAAELQPHRATFNLSMVPGAPASSGILGVLGRMLIEFEQVCDGYVTRQALQMLVRDALGQTTETRYTLTTWESSDGREMTFDSTSTFGTQSDPSYAGRATKGEGAGAGRIAYHVPNGNVPLRPGAVFPTEHLRSLLDAAAKGEKLLTQEVFEGGAPQNYTAVNSSIGDTIAADPAAKLTGARKSWNVREAHFRPGGRSEAPEFEVGLRIYEGGIIDGLDLDHGIFRVAGKLSALELLPPPRC